MNGKKLLAHTFFILFLSLNFFSSSLLSMGDNESSDEKSCFPKQMPFSILVIEEGENSIGFYNSKTRKETHRLHLNYFPHEVVVDPDGRKAYVSNFGIRDYDYKVGHPGNCISVIDLENFCEVRRLYTKTQEGVIYWGPHGLKIHPNGKELYVNVECVNERYPSSNRPQDSVMLVFNLETHRIDRLLPSPSPSHSPHHTYPLLPGTHNFVFAPSQTENKKQEADEDAVDLWYYAGSNGVICIDPQDGKVKKHYSAKADPASLDPTVFNGAVRGLSVHPSGFHILASARNELSLIPISDQKAGPIIKYGNLGVGQLFYSTVIPEKHLALAPAAREGQVLVVDIDPNSQKTGRERVRARITTGVDPLQVVMSPVQGEQLAYVTNANSPYISEVDLTTFQEHTRIKTRGGGNGIAFSRFTQPPEERFLELGACLPLSGQYAAEGRECRIGLQFWEEAINQAGGFVVNGLRYFVRIFFGDTGSSTKEEELKEIFNQFMQSHDKVVSMFGTYPSSANLPLARVLSPSNIPLITATGRDPALFNQGLSNVFGLAPLKESPDLIGAFQAIYKHTFPRPQTAMILACEDDDSLSESESLEKYLLQNGMRVLNPFIADSLKSSAAIILKHAPAYEESEALHEMEQKLSRLAEAAHKNCQFYPDLLFVVGHRRESAAILNRLAKEGFSYGGLIISAGLPNYHFLTQVTAPIENVMGSVTWCEACSLFAEDRFVASTDFARRFYERYSEDPSDIVAGAAASGIVFEAAMQATPHHSIGMGFVLNNLTDGLRGLNLTSFYGPIQLNESGANTGKSVVSVQLKTVDSKKQAVPIWPESTNGWKKVKFPSSQI